MVRVEVPGRPSVPVRGVESLEGLEVVVVGKVRW